MAPRGKSAACQGADAHEGAQFNKRKEAERKTNHAQRGKSAACMGLLRRKVCSVAREKNILGTAQEVCSVPNVLLRMKACSVDKKSKEKNKNMHRAGSSAACMLLPRKVCSVAERKREKEKFPGHRAGSLQRVRGYRAERPLRSKITTSKKGKKTGHRAGRSAACPGWPEGQKKATIFYYLPFSF